MNSDAEFLRAIYEVIRIINEDLKELSRKVESLEILLIPEEEISEEEAERLDRLAEETREIGQSM
jgi:hypothetical protein